MNKRGLSTIIITVIMIAIALAAIGVVWSVVSKIVSEKGEEAETTGSALFYLCSELNLSKVDLHQKCYGDEVISKEGACCDGLVYPVLKNNLVTNWEMIGDLNNGWWNMPNTILLTDPSNERTYVHDSAESSNPGACYNWAFSDLIPVDNLTSYKFSVYVKSTSPDMDNYLGFYVYDSLQNKIVGSWDNPYMKITANDSNTWVKWEGVLGASNLGGATECDTSATNGDDWCMSPNTAYALIRFGSCYGIGSGTEHTYFAYPSVEKI